MATDFSMWRGQKDQCSRPHLRQTGSIEEQLWAKEKSGSIQSEDVVTTDQEKEIGSIKWEDSPTHSRRKITALSNKSKSSSLGVTVSRYKSDHRDRKLERIAPSRLGKSAGKYSKFGAIGSLLRSK